MVTTCSAATPGAAAPDESSHPLPVVLYSGGWQKVGEGLELCEYYQVGYNWKPLLVLRIDPACCEVELHSASLEGHKALTPLQWARRHHLAAVINASMYLPDGMTSTAYMRSGDKVANGRIAEKYGAFFAASPRKKGLPSACLLDREADDWKKLLGEYDQVVQNFRLIGPAHSPHWPENGPHHSVAAVGMDASGFLYFLHYEPPVSIHGFVHILRESSGLELTHAMYVEGGAQAVLGLWTAERTLYRQGRHVIPFLTGEPLLPNILGVRLKSQP